jgi:hypothetical protein
MKYDKLYKLLLLINYIVISPCNSLFLTINNCENIYCDLSERILIY